jgi:hypothetical protein
VGVSLYVETVEPVTTEAATAALAGERIKVRRSNLDAPTPVEVTGSSDILVDSISIDAEHPNGLWLWAVADNLHLGGLQRGGTRRQPARKGPRLTDSSTDYADFAQMAETAPLKKERNLRN